MTHAYTGQGGTLPFPSGQAIGVASWMADVEQGTRSCWSGEVILNEFIGAIPDDPAMATLADQSGGSPLLEGHIRIAGTSPQSGQSGISTRCRLEGTGALKPRSSNPGAETTAD